MSEQFDLAVADCKYASSLSDFALGQHIYNWIAGDDVEDLCSDQLEYYFAIKEIADKLDTDECLLRVK